MATKLGGIVVLGMALAAVPAGASNPELEPGEQIGGIPSLQGETPPLAARSAEQVLSDQLAAFNAGDVESMVANVSDGFARIVVTSEGAVAQLAGRAQFRRSMEAYFASTPDARAEIVGMLANGSFVSAIERSFWIENGVERYQDALAVYEVRAGLIHRAWYYPVSAPAEEPQGDA